MMCMNDIDCYFFFQKKEKKKTIYMHEPQRVALYFLLGG